MHAIYLQEVLDAAQEQIRRLKQHADLKDKAIIILQKDELAAQRVPEAIAAVFQPNKAKSWPLMLITWLLERILSEHDAAAYNATNEHTSGPPPAMRVVVDRALAEGADSAREILFATNPYTPCPLPNMAGLITSVRGQACALEPSREAT